MPEQAGYSPHPLAAEATHAEADFPNIPPVDSSLANPQEEGKKAEKIEDFGEKLGGAKKDIARSEKAALAREFSDEELATQPLSTIWPKMDVDAIENPFVAAFSYAARAEIPSKPRKGYKLAWWVSQVKALRNLTSHILNLTEEKVRELALGSHLVTKQFMPKVNLLMAIDRGAWGRIGTVSEHPNAFRYGENSEQIPAPFISVEIDGKRHSFNGIKTVSEALGKVNELLGVEAQAKKMQFEVRGRGDSFSINKKGDSEYRKLKTFGSTKEAFDFIKNNYDDLVAEWEGVKARDNVKEDDVRNATNRERTAQDWRKGKDVTPEQFDEAFGFRGTEFGNWVSQGKNGKERQGMLNQSYDAFMDLADIVGIPPKAVSLNGSLGIGFGSRGSGKASAHYEPGAVIINLTKTRGAGTLAHEWFHALDNYFSRLRGGESAFTGDNTAYRQNNYITYKPEPMYVHKTLRAGALTKARLEHLRKQNPNAGYLDPSQWQLDPKHPQGVRPEVERAFAELVETLNASPMAARSARNDKGADGYWSRIIERGARSFENYVISKMMENGYHNDYLANVRAAEDFSRDQGRYPYLLQDEIAPVSEAFDNLFSTIETKETDKGVAMFTPQRATESTSTETTATKSRNELVTEAKAAVVSRDSLPVFGAGKGVSKQTARFIEQIARLLGKKVSFFSLKDGKDRPEGFYVDGDTIYINTQAQTAHLRILGHELTHTMERDAGEVYKTMLNAVSHLLTKKELAAQHFDYFGTELDVSKLDQPHKDSNGTLRDLLTQEWMADLSGNRFAEEGFWSSVFAQIETQHGASASKRIIHRLRQAIVKTLHLLNKYMAGNSFAVDRRLSANLDEVRVAVAKGFAEYIELSRKGQLDTVTGGGVQFLSREENGSSAVLETADIPQSSWDALKDFWLNMSQHKDLFTFKTTDATTLEQAFKDIVTERHPPTTINEAETNVAKGQAGVLDATAASPTERIWNISSGGTIHEDQGKVWISVGNMKSGSGGGAAVYSAVGQYAKNTGQQFIGDPSGFLGNPGARLGEIRRVEHLISQALRYGTTNHVTLGKDHSAEKGWKEGDTGHNLDLLLKESYANYKWLFDAVPALKGVTFDVESEQFIGKTGSIVSDASLGTILRGIGGSNERGTGTRGAGIGEKIGVATAKRAIIARSILQGRSTEENGRLLAAIDAKLDSTGLAAESGIRRVQYSTPRINVDGVDRPTTNSNGKPIHPTEEGIRNFWRWIDGLQRERLDRQSEGSEEHGRSQSPDSGISNRFIFDDQGRPRVFYHGTNADIESFDLDHSGKWDHGWLGRGVYLASDSELASFYAYQKGGQSNVMPMYAGVTNPYVFSVEEKRHLSKMTASAIRAITERARDNGYDGGVLEFSDGSIELVAFNNTAVKSATGNTGEFDGGNADIRFSTPRFVSQLATQIENAPKALENAPAAQWRMWINNSTAKLGVKKDEIVWSGVDDYLAMRGKDKVSKAEIAAFLSENGTKVQDVVLGKEWQASEEMRHALTGETRTVLSYTPEQWMEHSSRFERIAQSWQRNGDSNKAEKYFALSEEAGRLAEELDSETGSTERMPKFSQYVVPGGENYRELLVTLPEKSSASPERAEYERWARKYNGNPNSTSAEQEYERTTGRVAPPPRTMTAMNADKALNFKSSHFDQTNILVHLRMDERTDADGNPTLFLQEIQSDWGQEGKKKGFAGRVPTDAEIIEHFGLKDGADPAEYRQEMMDNVAKKSIPNAPFVTDTKSWVALGLKRAIMYAVQHGMTRVAWANGEQNAGHYDLSKQVRSIAWTGRHNDAEKNVTITPMNGNDIEFVVDPDGLVRGYGGVTGNEFDNKKIDDVIGKEMAERLMSEPYGDVRGNGLKVGGEGMRAFYDQIVPQVANDVLKKLGGGKVENIALSDSSFKTKQGAEDDALLADLGVEVKGERPTTNQGFTITDSMRAKVSEGVPLFSTARNWAQGIYDGNEPREPVMPLVRKPSAALNIAGIYRPITIDYEHVRHIFNTHHEITPEHIGRLPSELQSPRVVFKDGRGWRLFVNSIDDQGQPIAVALTNETLKDGKESLKVTGVSTMFGFNESARYVAKELLDGNVKYIKKEEAARVLGLIDAAKQPSEDLRSEPQLPLQAGVTQLPTHPNSERTFTVRSDSGEVKITLPDNAPEILGGVMFSPFRTAYAETKAKVDELRSPTTINSLIYNYVNKFVDLDNKIKQIKRANGNLTASMRL